MQIPVPAILSVLPEFVSYFTCNFRLAAFLLGQRPEVKKPSVKTNDGKAKPNRAVAIHFS
jgi:hypothetical protein